MPFILNKIEPGETVRNKGHISAEIKPDSEEARSGCAKASALRICWDAWRVYKVAVIHLLQTRPMNTNQIASAMGLDYKAIQHHLEVLEKNNIVGQIGPKYGSMFHLSNYLESNIMALDSVIASLERQTRRKIVYL